MRLVALVLIYVCAVTRAQRPRTSCSIALDRKVCALPVGYTNDGKSNDSVCVIGGTITIKLPKPLHECGGLDVARNFFAVNTLTLKSVRLATVLFNETYIESESGLVHYLGFARTAESLMMSTTMLRKARVHFYAVPDYSRCFGRKCSSEEVYLKSDNAPTVRFEVHDAVSLRDTSNNTVFKSVPQSVNSSVTVKIDVRDEDVFDGNKDAFEYSTVGEPKVSMSADVQLFYQTHHVNLSAINQSPPDSRSATCELPVGWCEKENGNWTAKNHVQVKYSFSMTDLTEAVRALVDQAMLPELHYAEVVVKMHALATSGRNRLTGSGSLTLVIRMPKHWILDSKNAAGAPVSGRTVPNSSKHVGQSTTPATSSHIQILDPSTENQNVIALASSPDKVTQLPDLDKQTVPASNEIVEVTEASVGDSIESTESEPSEDKTNTTSTGKQGLAKALSTRDASVVHQTNVTPTTLSTLDETVKVNFPTNDQNNSNSTDITTPLTSDHTTLVSKKPHSSVSFSEELAKSVTKTNPRNLSTKVMNETTVTFTRTQNVTVKTSTDLSVSATFPEEESESITPIQTELTTPLYDETIVTLKRTPTALKQTSTQQTHLTSFSEKVSESATFSGEVSGPVTPTLPELTTPINDVTVIPIAEMPTVAKQTSVEESHPTSSSRASTESVRPTQTAELTTPVEKQTKLNLTTTQKVTKITSQELSESATFLGEGSGSVKLNLSELTTPISDVTVVPIAETPTVAKRTARHESESTLFFGDAGEFSTEVNAELGSLVVEETKVSYNLTQSVTRELSKQLSGSTWFLGGVSESVTAVLTESTTPVSEETKVSFNVTQIVTIVTSTGNLTYAASTFHDEPELGSYREGSLPGRANLVGALPMHGTRNQLTVSSVKQEPDLYTVSSNEEGYFSTSSSVLGGMTTHKVVNEDRSHNRDAMISSTNNATDKVISDEALTELTSGRFGTPTTTFRNPVTMQEVPPSEGNDSSTLSHLNEITASRTTSRRVFSSPTSLSRVTDGDDPCLNFKIKKQFRKSVQGVISAALVDWK